MLLNMIRKHKAITIISSLIVAGCISILTQMLWPILAVVLICLLSVV